MISMAMLAAFLDCQVTSRHIDLSSLAKIGSPCCDGYRESFNSERFDEVLNEETF
jgi:hypothetical protein